MSETVNQGTNATGTNAPDNNVTPGNKGGERTFTQAEMDAVISERLNRERLKYQDYDQLKEKAAKFDQAEEANKSEVQKATERAASLEAELNALKKSEEIRSIREKVAKEKNVPAELLSGDTEETCKAQADKLLEFAKPNGYPTVKDGGEANNGGKVSTRQQFADWAAKAL